MASFYVIRGRDNGQHFAIRGPISTIGRESSNQIHLSDTEVSRQHASVRRTENAEFEIGDLDSSNGTFVNSHPVKTKILHSGDRVQVGRTLMIFTGGPEPHSTRSVDGVEIVTDQDPHNLSQIRRTVESHLSSALGSRSEPAAPDSAGSEPSTTSSGNVDDWELIYQVSQAINRTLDLNDLLRQVLDLIFQWIECDRGCVMLLDDVTSQLVPTYIRDRKQQAGLAKSARHKLQISRTILDHVMKTREGVLTSNAQADARWENVESISSLGVHEAICVPMSGRYGLVGAIYVHTQVSAGVFAERHGNSSFEESHLKLMCAIADQAALAIEDTQFYRAMLQSERLAAMGQTIANLSHHVKNILQGVSGGSYLVDEGLKQQDFSTVQRGWSIVLKNQERIGNLVMDMLSFSKEREPDLCQADVHQLIIDILELIEVRARDAGVKLVFESAPQPLLAMFDMEAMHRALLNVVSNAVDAAAAAQQLPEVQPQVSIVAEILEDQKTVCIGVTDNGDGIEETDLPRIFSPFESSKGSRGTGLGLPVSQKILREHGGDISVCSEVGTGTTFSLHWPRGMANDAQYAQVGSETDSG